MKKWLEMIRWLFLLLFAASAVVVRDAVAFTLRHSRLGIKTHEY